MDKLKMETPNFTDKNIEKILELFPNVATETEDENGKIKRAINFEKLKQELLEDVVDGDECYDFTWVGKREAIIESNKPIRKTLRPCEKESESWETTENLYIEGDNLDVLKLLQESYLNQVKMIYIDPPYNTGSDFIYRDDFTQTKNEYEDELGVEDEEGNRLFQNTETNGRFHSDWCSMIYPRLKLARNLLTDDGVIFISIDDNEIRNLKNICDEVFGEVNFIANIIWSRKRGKDNSAKFLSRNHEYALIYSKNIQNLTFGRLEMPESTRKAYTNPDNDPRGDYRLQGIWARGSQGGSKYSFTSKTGQFFEERLWLVGNETMIELDRKDELVFKGDNIYKKLFISAYKGDIPETIWLDASNAANAADEIKSIFGAQIFDTVKPIPYICKMLKIGINENDTVLDFFSGSATTAHSVMQLNLEENKNLKYIMVQMPEPTYEIKDGKEVALKTAAEAYNAGYKTICEIGKERIRRAGKKIKEENPDKNIDTGFRVFKLDSTNMKDVYYTPAEYNQGQLNLLESNIKEDRNDMDLLYGVLLDWGVELSLPHRIEEIDGKRVHIVNNDDLIACFEENITEIVVREIAKKQPTRAVFRDGSFNKDDHKINVEEIFKLNAPNTTVKVI